MTSDTGFGGVWTLNDRGFRVIRESLGPLKEAGYKSEAIGHDLLSMAAMLGEWLQERPNGVETFAEQQLRRYDSSLYPVWIPQTDSHRPDGFWRLPVLGNQCTVALEIERTRKDIKSYDFIADYYQETPSIYRVLWITPIKNSNPIENRIRSRIQQDSEKHLFVDLKEFTDFGWQSVIRSGFETGKTISDFLVSLSSQCNRRSDSRLLLETRKKPMILDSNKILATHAFFN